MELTNPKASGFGRVLVLVYGVFAVAATSRAVFQILTKFDDAPVAYLLSALAGVVYILATVALALPGRRWTTVAWGALAVELAGVLVVGTFSLAEPELFPQDTVWSVFGKGYLFIPLVLPFLGLWWLWRSSSPAAAESGEGR